MDEWKDQLKDLYKSYSTNQKNIKGTTSKFDTPSHANFRGKIGVNDTGIPLTPKAAKRKQSNRAGYRYPQHLQNINERRRKDAMAKHGITNIEDPYNKMFKDPAQPAARSNRSISWRPPMEDTPTVKRKNIYYDEWSAPSEPEQIEYILPPEPRKQPAYKAKMVKRDSKLQFKNKLEEAIYNHPNYKKQFK